MDFILGSFRASCNWREMASFFIFSALSATLLLLFSTTAARGKSQSTTVQVWFGFRTKELLPRSSENMREMYPSYHLLILLLLVSQGRVVSEIETTVKFTSHGRVSQAQMASWYC